MKGDLGLHELWTGRNVVARAGDQGRAAAHRPCGFMGWRAVLRVRDGFRLFVVTGCRRVAPSGRRRVPLGCSEFEGCLGRPGGSVRGMYSGLEM